MQFARLRLAGFKSFADAAEIDIRPGLTGIVGPNGCGKSNLLEGLRWVMGEGSARALRTGAGMDDVIFAGTLTRPRQDQARVTLTLANPERAAPAGLADSAEIIVERLVRRGEGSTYRLNGVEARQKDVRLLFADAATGAGSPALVSQGQVAALIRARPQDRRQLLEEAAGIAGLNARRADAEQRLRAVAANLARVAENLSDSRKRAAALERQARQAARYRELSAQIRAAEEVLLRQQWAATVAEAQESRSRLQEVAAELGEASASVAAQAQAAAAAAQALAGKREARAQAAARLQQATAAHAAAVAEAQAAIRRRADLAAAIADAQADAERERARAADAAASEARLAAELAVQLQAGEAQVPPPDTAAIAAHAEAAARALRAALDAQAQLLAEAHTRRAAATAARNRQQRCAQAEARQQAEVERLAAAAVQAPQDAQVAAMAAALQQLDADIAAAQAAIRAADAEAEAARQRQAQAEAARQAPARQVAALEAEAAALARLQRARPAADRERALRQQIAADSGFEAALAAALGADIEAGVGAGAGRYWRLLPAAADAQLPAFCAPLAAHVQAPPELARLLAQTGVVAAAPAAAQLHMLKAGQQLVSADGWLWRWDGLVAPPGAGADAAAEALRQDNRRRQIDSELPAPRQQLAAADAALAGAQAARQQADKAAAAARTACAQLEDKRRPLPARLQAARAAAAQAAERQRAARDLLQRLQAETAAATAESAAADAAVAALPDSAAADAAVAAARAGETEARTALAAARAEAAAQAAARAASARRENELRAEQQAWAARARDSATALMALQARLQRLQAEQADAGAAPQRLAAHVAALAKELQAAEAAGRSAEADVRAAEAMHAEAQRAGSAAQANVARLRERQASLSDSAARLQAELAALVQQAHSRFARPPAALADGPPTTPEELAELQAARERIGAVNLRAELELQELQADIETQATASADLDAAVNRLRGSIGALNRAGRERLLAAFRQVDGHFRDLFTTLFGGGIAELQLVDDADPLLAGLEIRAQPPGKKLQSLSLLSGGEQALTAIALVFALFRANAAPICVLDEVDAPLDDANVERLLRLLAHMARTTPTRFLVVTHNPLTMAAMQRLYGVTMPEAGISRLVSAELQQAQALAGS